MIKSCFIALVCFILSSCSFNKKEYLPLSKGDCFSTGKEWRDLYTGEVDPLFEKYYIQILDVREHYFSFQLKPYSKKTQKPKSSIMSDSRDHINPKLKIQCPKA